MTLLPSDHDSGPRTWINSVSGFVRGSHLSARDPQEVIPPEDRKAVMSKMDRTEHKLALGGLALGLIAGIAIPLYVVSQNRVDKHGKNSIAVAPDAWLLMGAILLFCVLGFIALWKQKRTLVTFCLFLIGFGFTLFIGVIGFAFILLGGWLMLRAWRVNKYGSSNSKVVAREAAAARAQGRTKGAKGKEPVRTSSSSSSSAPRKPPTASKRYTPKSPARKKIPKPTE